MNENKIEIRNLSKAFGKKVVLDGIDLDVKRGESLVVIGGSGTGKSVLIKCIQGLLNADSGSIKVDEEEVVGAPRKQVEAMHTVPGSAILVGGDPGIGKSTLLLQACASIANLPSHPECYYISGEEAIDQVRIRAKRLQLEQSPVKLTSATDVKDIIATLEKSNAAVVIIDSIQTMYLEEVESTPGSVSHGYRTLF